MEKIIVKDIIRQNNRVDISFTVSEGLKKYFIEKHNFFAEYSCDISDVPDSVLVIPLLLNLIPFSWTTNCTVWADKVDRDFYEAVPRLKHAFEEMHHNVKFGGAFIAARIEDNSYNVQRECISLFTGGVDATTTFFRIRNKNPILLNIYGWFEDEITSNTVFDADKNAIENFAQYNNVECCFVRSNFGNLVKASVWNKKIGKKLKTSWWLGFQHSMAFLGCAAVVGYHYKVKNLYIASSWTFGYDMACASDPRTDTQVSVAGMRTIHDGYELSRQSKIKYLVETQKNLRQKISLRVCSFKEKNCCHCEKCLRTMLALEAEGGRPEDFGFDLSDTFLSTVKHFLNTEILELNARHKVYWDAALERMKDNMENVPDKEVYELLINYPFERERKSFLLKYYRKNFWKILKRKLKI